MIYTIIFIVITFLIELISYAQIENDNKTGTFLLKQVYTLMGIIYLSPKTFGAFILVIAMYLIITFFLYKIELFCYEKCEGNFYKFLFFVFIGSLVLQAVMSKVVTFVLGYLMIFLLFH